MEAILLFSHGSLLCGAGETLQSVAERLRRRGAAPIIAYGYLNYAQPTFESTFAQCVALGATRIVVVPYFLVAGKFVQVDLPPRIAAMCEAFPTIEVKVAGALGFHPSLAEAVLRSAASARSVGDWHESDEHTARVCQDNPTCPRYGTGACPAGMSVGRP